MTNGPLTFGGAGNISVITTTQQPFSSSTFPLTKTGAGTLLLNPNAGVPIFTVPTPIAFNSGTLTVTLNSSTIATNSPLSTGTITITPQATPTKMNFTYVNVVSTLGNPFVIANAPGTATIDLSSGIMSTAQPITFAPQSGGIQPLLNLENDNGVPNPFTLSGGITGPGDLKFTVGGNGAQINVTTSVVNNIGSITNVGGGNQTTTINGGIGPNITKISQQSGNAPITIASLASSTLQVNPAGLILDATGATTALFTISTVMTGTGGGTAATGVTVTGTASQTNPILFSGLNTYTGGYTLNGAVSVVGISTTSTGGPFGPTVTSFPLVLNGGAIRSNTNAAFTVGNLVSLARRYHFCDDCRRTEPDLHWYGDDHGAHRGQHPHVDQ